MSNQELVNQQEWQELRMKMKWFLLIALLICVGLLYWYFRPTVEFVR